MKTEFDINYFSFLRDLFDSKDSKLLYLELRRLDLFPTERKLYNIDMALEFKLSAAARGSCGTGHRAGIPSLYER